MIIIYTLTQDGQVPTNVTDGGYFPKPNNNIGHNHLDLVGIATSSESERTIADRQELMNYVSEFYPNYIDPFTGQIITVTEMVNSWCDQRGIK